MILRYFFSYLWKNVRAQFETLGDFKVMGSQILAASRVRHHRSTRALEGGGSYSYAQETLHQTSLKAGGTLSFQGKHLMTQGVALEAEKLTLEVERWGDRGVITTTQDRRVEPGTKEDAVYTGSSSVFHPSSIEAQEISGRVGAILHQGTQMKGQGVLEAQCYRCIPGYGSTSESSHNVYIQERRHSTQPVPGSIEGVRVEPFTDLSQASTAMTPLEGLHLSLQQGAFQGTQFVGEVRIEAREKLLLTPAVRQDGFEKVVVLKDSSLLIIVHSLFYGYISPYNRVDPSSDSSSLDEQT
ncbi:hypothetical protein [Holospora curviuscula]|uniref:Uncharacterized protein n=1 Tax=Holospora curviuscula TaxID=1082868 RepID=A0A2S5R8B2_9PROT|nr:hypothetical protein [Holospora curviuscula]PPE03540.1 hypothetical protein HCUR_01011 [Holospora curviuscula]